ncbi:hypothetical protein Syun_013350 [Stephania yunnanensis]|uniref:Bidirectional sugar transporter SWEET n=1 Tax=Stephania yunnanensis TaxID=152371 RepID=A0AAP0PJR7_9MAGN
MGGALRLVIGIMGNAASLLLYTAPILTFVKVIKKRSTGEFSCVPYTLALFNCLTYTWYGLPLVSDKWENFPLVTTNGIGVFLETFFIITYLCFASSKRKVILASSSVISILVAFCIVVMVSLVTTHDHRQRKVLVGTAGLIASVAMYGSPLVVMKQVIKTKSVEFMPFHLSLFSLAASSLWMIYGFLGNDIFVASPNLVGTPLGVFQIVLYCMYRKRGIASTEEMNKEVDLEKNNNEERLKVQQMVADEKQ